MDLKDWSKVVILLALVGLLGFFGYQLSKGIGKDSELGAMAVKSLYHFQTIEELDANMDVLKELTTAEVYQQLTIDSTERALRVYLKFEGNPSSVKILESKPGYIRYKLDSSSIDASRTFLFTYEVEKGKISKAYEAEILPFTSNTME